MKTQPTGSQMGSQPLLLLIDTNIFVTLTSVDREEHLLKQLCELTKAGVIKLLVPAYLSDEWYSQRGQTIRKIKSETVAISEVDRQAKISGSAALHKVEQRAIRIDQLLAEGIKIRNTKAVNAEVGMRLGDNRPPFHNDNSKSSSKDAFIYFSAQRYLLKKKQGSYVFISDNKKQFSDPKDQHQLHTQLEHPELECHYYRNLGRFFNANKEYLGNKLKDSEAAESMKIFRIIPKETGDILEDIYQTLKECEASLPFTPLPVLVKVYPFRVRKKKSDFSDHSGQTLYTNNEKLISLFESVDMETLAFKQEAYYTNTRVNLQRLRYVLDYLNRHLVFFIALRSASKYIKIYTGRELFKKDLSYFYRMLDWKKMLEHLTETPATIEAAQVLFNIGEEERAFQIVQKLYDKAVSNNDHFQAFRYLHNLKYIAVYLFSTKSEELAANATRARSADLEEEYFKMVGESEFKKELARYFKDHADMREHATIITEDLKLLLEHHEMQLRGGISSNSYPFFLINHFIIFDRYTDTNGWMYTRYSNYEKIAADFVKGIFLGLSLNQYQPSKIKYLDSYLMAVLLWFGKSDQLKIHFERYLKHTIACEEPSHVVQRLLKNHFNVDADILKKITGDQHFEMSKQYYKVFWNSLFLLSHSDLNSIHVKPIIAKLPLILAYLPKSETMRLKHLANLVRLRKDDFTATQLKGLFRLYTEKELLHDDGVFSAIMFAAKSKNLLLVRTVKTFDSLLKVYWEKCPKCGKRHTDLFYELYEVVGKHLKIRMRELIEGELNRSANFDMFYKASIYMIIDPRQYFKQYADAFQLPKERYKGMLEGELTMIGLNEFLNISYTFSLPLPAEFKVKMKGWSDYYDWLLDMEGFDYQKFNPIWLLQYEVHAYLKKAFSIPALRKSTQDYLRKNHQPKIAGYYSQFVNP